MLGGIRSLFGPHSCREMLARPPREPRLGTRRGGAPASRFFLEPAVGADLRQDDEAIENEMFGP